MITRRAITRGECRGKGVCPFVSCKHHLFLDIAESGSLISNRLPSFTSKSKHFNDWANALVNHLVAATYTCSLDVASDGGLLLAEVGEVYGLSNERVRQIECAALEKLRLIGAIDE